jgi:hypothetical protein
MGGRRTQIYESTISTRAKVTLITTECVKHLHTSVRDTTPPVFRSLSGQTAMAETSFGATATQAS